MSLDPYAELGLGRDATEDEINRAFRERAKKAHPDGGGTTEEFTRLRASQLVLLDPERRKKFDNTGQIDPEAVDQSEAEALAVIARLMAQIMGDEKIEPWSIDIVTGMRDGIMREIIICEEAIAQTARAQARIDRMRKRFRRRSNNNDNIFEKMLDKHARLIATSREGPTKAIVTFKRALEILSEYEFDAEKMDNTAGHVTWFVT